MANFNITIISAENSKTTSATFPVADAVTDPALTALWTANAGLVLGVQKESNLTTSVAKNQGTNDLPASGAAQRTTKWLCRYADTNNKVYTLEIGTANHDLLTPPSDFLDLTTDPSPGFAFKTAFDAAVKRAGLDCTLLSVQAVNRTG